MSLLRLMAQALSMETEVKMEPEKLETGKTLYEECATHLRYMLEWRHKLILRFFVANASFLVVVKWLWETENEKMRSLIFVPFLLGAIASCAFYFMDKRNMKVVKICREEGGKIEKEIFQHEGLFVSLGSRIEKTRGIFSYTGMLALIYLGFACIMLLCAILSFKHFSL